MLAEGSALPHFEIRDIHGRRITYRVNIWQRKYLLLVTPAAHGRTSREQVAHDLERLANDDVVVVIAADQVSGIPAGATVIADRWGEIAKIWEPSDEQPSLRELEEWITHVRMRCPECEGEAR